MEAEYQSGDFVLAHSSVGTWGGVSDHLWRDIVQRFAVKYCNAISFDCIATAGEVTELTVFSDHQPSYIDNAEYQPNSIPMTAIDSAKFTNTVARFTFDNWIASLLITEPFSNWHCSNDGCHADEIVLWRGNLLAVHAIPWEGIVYFNSLTLEQLRSLKTVSPEIGPNLYSR